ncbi:MAG: SMP-30/gluconolactonase/LRE family protein [Gemmatimonadota bacterium]|nr:SMP-30/gluconolactonase/LRE family protein [Gemmatimonadota bacterium]
MSMQASPQNVCAARARLGEGPTWNDTTQSLCWVDILNHRVHQFRPESGENRSYQVGDVVGCAVPTRGNSLLLALRHDLAMLDLASGEVRHLLAVEPDKPKNRLNDGKCDPRGRFWIGSMREEEAGHGSLYRYDPDGSLHVMETGLGISNGLGWSPDESTFYLTDSPAQTIYAYNFDAAAGSISNQRVFVDLSGEDFFPDGLTVDSEGCIWSAQWAGACVIRFAPSGRELLRVPVPVKQPTSCVFGGPGLKQLYITSASVGLSQQEIEEYFFSGDLFCLSTGVAGLPTSRFAGDPLSRGS